MHTASEHDYSCKNTYFPELRKSQFMRSKMALELDLQEENGYNPCFKSADSFSVFSYPGQRGEGQISVILHATQWIASSFLDTLLPLPPGWGGGLLLWLLLADLLETQKKPSGNNNLKVRKGMNALRTPPCMQSSKSRLQLVPAVWLIQQCHNSLVSTSIPLKVKKAIQYQPRFHYTCSNIYRAGSISPTNLSTCFPHMLFWWAIVYNSGLQPFSIQDPPSTLRQQYEAH